ncbi:MAG TPA: NADH-quinone oxidoreductase subunit H [Ruminiclostridium sp.]|nr:NADH-quinone oxidoreductase subunit H [Ruminiclostridium sp.]
MNIQLSTLTIQIIIAVVVIILAPLAGGILSGVDRKLTARMQGRQGPPVIQPFYDVIKLFGKERIAVNKMQDAYVISYAIFNAVAAVMLFTGQDLLMLVFVLAIADVSLIMGAMCVRSSYSRIGAQREIIQMMASEPVIIFTAIGVYLVNHSFLGLYVFMNSRPLILSLPLQFIALLIILTIKLRKSPFDFSTSHHGHQELIKGLTIEFSGFQLALINIGEWFELVLLLGLVAIFCAQPFWIGIILAAAAFFLEILIDNISARTTWAWMLKVAGTAGIGLSAANIILLYLR